jgi:hypothetical protein
MGRSISIAFNPALAAALEKSDLELLLEKRV